MAQDSDLSNTADKGKGKAVDNEPKADEAQKDKAGQPAANGKKGDEKDECLFSSLAPHWHLSVSGALTAI